MSKPVKKMNNYKSIVLRGTHLLQRFVIVLSYVLHILKYKIVSVSTSNSEIQYVQAHYNCMLKAFIYFDAHKIT